MGALVGKSGALGYGFGHKSAQVHYRGKLVSIRSRHVEVKSVRPGVGEGHGSEPTTGQTVRSKGSGLEKGKSYPQWFCYSSPSDTLYG